MTTDCVGDVGSSSDPCGMTCKPPCPSLPDLLRKTVLTFCEGSVKFQSNLEVIGSLHIRSDNDRVVTFLLDEQLRRENVPPPADSVADSSPPDDTESIVKVVDDDTPTGLNLSTDKRYYSNDYDRSATETDVDVIAYPLPKKSRKILKPIKKIYGSLGESTDGDSEMDLYDHTGGNNDPVPAQNYIVSQPPPMIRKNDYLTSSTPVPDTLSPRDAYRRVQESRGRLLRMPAVSGMSPATSPQPPQLEVSSTRPDDSLMPPRQSSITSDASGLDEASNVDGSKDNSNMLSIDIGDSRGMLSRSPSIKVEDTSTQLTPHSSGHGSLTPSSDIIASSEHRNSFSVSPQPYGLPNGQDDRQPPMLVKEGYIHRSFEGRTSAPPPSELAQMSAPDMRRMMYPIMSGFGSYYNSSTDSGYFGESKDSSVMFGTSQSSVDSISPKDTLICPEQNCGKVLKSDKMLELHMNTAHTHKNTYPCKQCGKKFYAASSLHSHKRRTHDEQKYKCPYCTRCYAFQSELLHHLESVHPHFSVSSSAEPAAYGNHLTVADATKFHDADQHHLLFASSPVYPTPQLAHVSQSSTESDPGPPASDSQPIINFHSLSQDSMNIIPDDPERNNNSINSLSPSSAEAQSVRMANGVRFKCSDCGLLLKSRECLALHVNAKHTQKLSYPCNVCGKVFYAPSSRFCHMRRVHASIDQKFHCSYCEKVFSFHYELRNHMKMWHRQKLIQRSDGIETNEVDDNTVTSNGGISQQLSPNPSTEQEPANDQKMPCNYCEKTFEHHYELCKHMKMIHGLKLMQQSESIDLEEASPSAMQTDEPPQVVEPTAVPP